MLTHEIMWNAIDGLADAHGLSASGLAKLGGLDPTTFNKSKRINQSGKMRWPTTESLAKVLAATHTSLREFVNYIEEEGSGANRVRLPALGVNGERSEIIRDMTFPMLHFGDHAALSVQSEAFSPVIHANDIIVLNDQDNIKAGDRVILFLSNKHLDIGTVRDMMMGGIELHSYGGNQNAVRYSQSDVVKSMKITAIYT